MIFIGESIYIFITSVFEVNNAFGAIKPEKEKVFFQFIHLLFSKNTNGLFLKRTGGTGREQFTAEKYSLTLTVQPHWFLT